MGYDLDYEIINNLGTQSADIALGTNELKGGAGDNGMMFGYACRDTQEFLPLAMVILQKFSREYDLLRQKDSRFKSDGKAQITGLYENNKLIKIETMTICYQNTEKERTKTDKIIKQMITKICDEYQIPIAKMLINPTGKFLIGGFEADAGVTGRKIVVDNYQSFAPVGGGAFSGKDPSKVDRSGAYMARYLAKKILKDNSQYYWCEIQISYAIGIARPLAIYIKTDLEDIFVTKDLYGECTLPNIIKTLNLKNINYEEKARFGHFRD